MQTLLVIIIKTEVDGAIVVFCDGVIMEDLLYNSILCRLCGEESENGIFLFSSEDNEQNLCELINRYLPIKLSDDGQLPCTICPGCNIQLEATMEFINLIVKGQKLLRGLHQKQIDLKKSEEPTLPLDANHLFYKLNNDGVYDMNHPIALNVLGIDKPNKKRGRPPKKPKTLEELAEEAEKAESMANISSTLKQSLNDTVVNGKRRRKTPTRFKEAVQGKELERIFIQEGIIDGEESDPEAKGQPENENEVKPAVQKVPEVIGHSQTSGELVVVMRGKGRGRPKGRLRSRKQTCAICGLEFTCVGRYMSHIAQHGPVRYQCEACLSTFTTWLLFNEHQKAENHTGQIVIQPQDEQSVTETQPESSQTDPQRKHLEIVIHDVMETDGNDTNSETDKTANTNESQNEETKETTSGAQLEEPDVVTKIENGVVKKKLKCNLCDKMFSNKQNKEMHMKATHSGEKPYVCKECGAAFPYPRSLSLHLITHRRTNAAKGFACDLCGKVLSHPSSVVYHKETAHAGQSYACNKCCKTFRHKQLLQRHQLVHSQLRPHSCKTCNMSFKTKANLMNHQLLHAGIKRHQCEQCKQKFSHKTSLTLHMQWHTGQKPYVCMVCDKSFTQKGNLSEHVRTHTGEKPYRCSQCSRAFTTSSQLRMHLRKHSGERPFPCPHCGKKFLSRESWSGHMRRETSTRRYRCDCGRGFTERWALTKHRRSHTGERPFRCPHCARAFADSSNLNKHKKQVHKLTSLLAPKVEESTPPPTETEERIEERVILVSYDVDEATQTLHILDPEQSELECDNKILNTCELYQGPALLTQQLDKDDQPTYYKVEDDIILEDQNMTLAVEHDNQLHFTMQDGTRLAITSVDGKTLQVVTQDGQTIPVELNEVSTEEEIQNDDSIVHELQTKTDEDDAPAHYYTIV